MCAGGGTGNRAAEGNERNACLSQKTEERLTLSAVRVKCHIEGIPMVETEAIMGGGLAQSTDRQSATKGGDKKFLDFRNLRKPSQRSSIEAKKVVGFTVAA